MTTTFHQSKRLWELGVRKLPDDMYSRQAGSDKFTLGLDGSFCVIVEQYPAYNAEELSSMIRGDLEIVRRDGETGYAYYTFGSFKDEDGIEYWGQVCGSTLTEALGNRLIHDLENNIITLEEINK